MPCVKNVEKQVIQKYWIHPIDTCLGVFLDNNLKNNTIKIRTIQKK